MNLGSLGRGGLFGGCAAIALMHGVCAAAETGKAFSIPPGGLSVALRQFAEQSDREVLYSSGLVQEKRTAGFSGPADADSALRKVLAGSNLTYEVGARGAFLIRTQSSAQGAAVAPAAAPPVVRVARPAPVATDVEEIVVTGSRLQPGGFSAPTPVTVVGTEYLEQRAPANAGELLNEFPQFRSSAGPNQNQSRVDVTAAAELLDLRGLGSQRTLVLVDGRRHVPTTVIGSVDLNVIPTTLLDRTEVVTGGASAAYGSDAVAGVVNVILRDRLEGVRATVQTGISQYGDNQSYLAGLGGGFSFAGGRGHVILGGEYSKNDGVGSKYERDWGRKETYGPVPLGATRPAGVPANLIADNVHFTFPSGGIVASGPLRGIAFGVNGVPYQYQFGSLVGSTFMIGGEGYGESPHGPKPLRVAYDRGTSLGRVTFELTPSLAVFAEGGYARVRSYPQTVPTSFVGNITILRDNPFLPASILQQMVTLNLPSLSLSRNGFDMGLWTGRNVVETSRGVFGARGDLRGDWSWDAYYERGVTRSSYKLFNNLRTANFFAAVYAVPGPNGPVCGPIATNPYFLAQTADARARLIAGLSPNCVPINVLGYGAPSAAALEYVQGGTFHQQIELTQQVAAANLRGHLFSTWAGPVSVALGAEWRKDESDGSTDPLSALGGWNFANPQALIGAITVKEYYAEAEVPLARDLPFAKSLSLNGAARRADYSTSGAVTTWKVGMTYEPVSFLLLRATKSRDIRAPNLFEVFNKGTTSIVTVTNPRNGVAGRAILSTSGNPNLVPESADTNTIGVTWRSNPAWAPNLRLSADYFSIDIAKGITTLAQQDIIDRYYLRNQTEFAQYITFDNSSLGFNGILSVPYNAANLKTNGVDLELAFRAPLERLSIPGRLDVRAVATWTDDLRTIDPVSRVDTDTAGAAVPEWQGNVNLTYAIGGLSTNLNARFFTPIKFGVAFIGPDDPNYNPAASNSINKNLLPGLAYFSAGATYDLRREGDSRVQVFGVVDNLLNTDPPAGASQVTVGNPYDLVGRTFKVGVRVQH